MSTTSSFDPWEVVRGDLWEDEIALFDDDEKTRAADLTAATVAGEIAWDGGSLSLTEGNSRIAVASPRSAGRITVTIEGADNVAVPLGQVSRLRIWVVDADDERHRKHEVWVRVRE